MWHDKVMVMYEKLQAEMRAAMRAGDEVKKNTLSMLLSKIKYAQIDNNNQPLTGDQVLKVIQSQIKQRRESIEDFKKGGRQDLADKEAAELKVLQGYMPQQLTGAALQDVIRQAIAESGAANKKDMGKVMKHLSANYAGQYDGKEASQAVGQLLP